MNADSVLFLIFLAVLAGGCAILSGLVFVVLGGVARARGRPFDAEGTALRRCLKAGLGFPVLVVALSRLVPHPSDSSVLGTLAECLMILIVPMPLVAVLYAFVKWTKTTKVGSNPFNPYKQSAPSDSKP